MKQREEDFVQEMFVSSSHDNVLFITNKGIMYKLRCFEIPEGSKQSRGLNIVNILPMGEGESIAAMLNTADFSEGKYVIMVTKNGKIKRTSLDAYKNVRKNGLIAIGLDEGDEIASVVLTDGTAQLMIATRNGMAIRIREENIRSMSRSAHGVKALTLRSGDRVVSMAIVREGAEVLTVTDKGQGRRSSLESYRIQNRGGFGMLNYKVSEEKGYVCGIRVVNEDEDVIMISTDGIIIRIRVSDVRVMGRYATGVRLMRIPEGESLAAFTSAEHDDTAETAKVEEPSAEELESEIAEAAKEESSEVIAEDTEVPDDDNEENTEE